MHAGDSAVAIGNSSSGNVGSCSSNDVNGNAQATIA